MLFTRRPPRTWGFREHTFHATLAHDEVLHLIRVDPKEGSALAREERAFHDRKEQARRELGQPVIITHSAIVVLIRRRRVLN